MAKFEMYRHFKITHKLALLDIIYGNFDKAQIASFCASLAKCVFINFYFNLIFSSAKR